MAFPSTSVTLIRRLKSDGLEADWRQFLSDYWGPLKQFAARRGSLTDEEAEDIASATLEVLLTTQLLERWHANRSAKLRTLLCAVVINLLSNRARVQEARQRNFRQFAEELAGELSPTNLVATAKTDDVFYATWVTELVSGVVRKVRAKLYAEGKGDYFRVLHGRLCERLSIAEISDSLEISTSAVDNYFRAARKRLSQEFEMAVREHVARYCDPGEVESEFEAEWATLRDYLRAHGGLERAVAEQAESSGTPRPSEQTKYRLRNLGHL